MYPITYLEKYCPLTSLLARKDCHQKKEDRPQIGSREQPSEVFRFPVQPGIACVCYADVDEIAPDWDLIAASSSALLRRSFLSAIAEAPPSGMDFRYLVFYLDEQPVGVAYFQLLSFKADRSFHFDPASTSSPRLKKWIARQFHNTLLFAGNALLTGQHAYCFKEDVVPPSLQTELIEKASWRLASHLRQMGRNIDAIVHKDVPESHLPAYGSWRRSAYHALRFQPNMEIRLCSEWQSFEDYLNALSSKYRVRARRAAKKSQELDRRLLTAEEVRRHAGTLFALYRHVAGQADFNLVLLHPDYFTSLKEKMGDQFEVFAYFDGDEMAGFCTLLHNGDRAEAHFLGYNPKINRSKQLYLNMLYDMIRAGIEGGKTHVGFARTALEIKSSVGAEPEEMYTLVRSYHPLPNPIIPPLVKFLEPERNWERRRPFSASP